VTVVGTADSRATELAAGAGRRELRLGEWPLVRDQRGRKVVSFVERAP